MSQTTYKFDFLEGKDGLIADTGPNYIISRAAEGAIQFGRFVTQGTDLDKQVKVPTAAADITTTSNAMGVAVRKENVEVTSEPAAVADTDDIAVMRQGRIYVLVEEAVTADSSVYVRYAATAQRSRLSFNADLVTSNTIDMDVNSVALTQVPFNTSNTQTLTDIATQLALLSSITSATADGPNDRIDIVAAASTTDIAITNIVVAAGASQANGTFAETTPSHLASEVGQFRTDADNTSAAALANARFLKSAAANALAILELNLI